MSRGFSNARGQSSSSSSGYQAFSNNDTELEDYVAPSASANMILGQELEDDLLGLLDLFGDEVTSTNQIRRIPAPSNAPFGRIRVHQIDDEEIGDVPVYNVGVDADVTDENVTFEQVVEEVFHQAYAFICRRSGRAANRGQDYAEIRLLRRAGSNTEALTYDLTSSMVVVDNAVDDFINLYLLMIQILVLCKMCKLSVI